MKLLQTITGTIEHMDHDGMGVIEVPDGKPVRVYNTIPGERIAATIVKRDKKGKRARLEEVIEASPDRVLPRCPFAGTCGGCKWQHMDYPRQLAVKLDTIRETFTLAGLPCPIQEVVPAPEIFFYRNRMDYVFGKNGQLGLKQPDRWWDTLDLTTCFLLSEDGVKIMNAVRDWSRDTGLPYWNSKTHQGFFRYLVIREGKRTGERLVMLVTSAAYDEKTEQIVRTFADVVKPWATSVVWGINPRLTDLSIADELIPLVGDPFIHEEINGVRYKITPNAFFQTNTNMAEQLQNVVMGCCGSGKTLLDLYCGSGFFSLALADRFEKTVGIELDAEAIACAKGNAAANKKNAEYFVSKAEDFDWSGYNPDVVILDPPRAGMHPKSIETFLKALPPKLVYVSCSYQRFIQESKQLLEAYTITEAVALDLFPHTPHVECVFKLERKS